MATDAERIRFLEEWARKSPTGVSIDWVPSVDGEPSGYRFMWRHHIGSVCESASAAIDQAIANVKRAT